jgi:hypothetical protein
MHPVISLQRTGSTVEMKRLVRSIHVQSDYVGWTRVNIRSAVDDWMRRSQTSGLIEVVVTDVRGQIIDASQVFEPRNCSYTPSRKCEFVYVEVSTTCA